MEGSVYNNTLILEAVVTGGYLSNYVYTNHSQRAKEMRFWKKEQRIKDTQQISDLVLQTLFSVAKQRQSTTTYSFGPEGSMPQWDVLL